MFLDLHDRASAGPAAVSEFSELVAELPVAIPYGAVYLTGCFASPPGPRAVALVVNDKGCARHRSALRGLARSLRGEGFATLMVDVLAVDEQSSPEVAAALRRNALLLARRVEAAREYAKARPELAALPLVLLAPDGACGAGLLVAAVRRDIAAVVGCAEGADEAGFALRLVRAPVLLAAANGDQHAAEDGHETLAELGGVRELVILPGRSLGDPDCAAQFARAAAAFAQKHLRD